MSDGHERSAAERETARRERENRRARRAGRPAPYEQAAAEFAQDPPTFDEPPAAHAEPPAADADGATSEPETAEHRDADGAAPEPPAHGPDSDTDPAAASDPDPDHDPDPDPAALPDPEPLVQPRDAAPPPIQSFPSPPDPEFYVPDDELETPSGTRRVSRAARASAPGGGGRGAGRPPRPTGRGRGGSRHPGGGVSRPRRWWPRALALVALLVVAAIVVFAIETFQPFGSSSHGPVTVRIPENTGSDAVARMLAHDGVISSSFFFELRATLAGDRGRIRAGTYHLHRGMSYGAVLTALTRVPHKAPTAQLTIDDGHTRQYVAALLARQHIKGSYLAATVHSPLLNPRRYGAPRSTRSLEGFLFPDTYTLIKPVRASALVADQLTDFKRRIATVSLAQAHRRHLNAFQVITIASLIEAESASPRDDRLVSSVIDNRLRDHMMLQLDSTARYATGNFTGALTQSQLNSRSPYNTHTHFGLPPGPIDSPGLTALNAAAHPASSSYLYFFSKPCTSQTVFASSYAQFQLMLARDYRPHCPH